MRLGQGARIVEPAKGWKVHLGEAYQAAMAAGTGKNEAYSLASVALWLGIDL